MCAAGRQREAATSGTTAAEAAAAWEGGEGRDWPAHGSWGLGRTKSLAAAGSALAAPGSVGGFAVPWLAALLEGAAVSR